MLLWAPAARAAGVTCRTSSAGSSKQVNAINTIARNAIKTSNLKSLIISVRVRGKTIYTRAFGESMGGVSATPNMHFRGGGVAFTYIGTIFGRLVDQRKLKLSDKVGKFFPGMPNADRVTLRMLLNMTSGYADYVYQPQIGPTIATAPFRQFTSQQLLDAGLGGPIQFEPGSNWGYSHTNMSILGKVAEKVTGKPLARLMREYIFGPMGLTQTAVIDGPAIPEPVLHSYSSERRDGLGVPRGTPFYEDSTFWNPTWTAVKGAVQTTDMCDATKSAEAIGSGKTLSRRSYAAMISRSLLGFGHPQEGCAACRQMTNTLTYGLGVFLYGHWVVENKSYAGTGGTWGYLPSKRVTIGVHTTYNEGAFDETGGVKDASKAVFNSLGALLVPSDPPPA